MIPLNSDVPPVTPHGTILLVDDDPDIRSLARTFLVHEGYRVFTSGDAERAINVFRSSSEIDLLIIDLYLPERSGMQLAKDLKALRQNLPILMISGGFLDPELRDQLQDQGWRFLAKPFSLPELLASVHVILDEFMAAKVDSVANG